MIRYGIVGMHGAQRGNEMEGAEMGVASMAATAALTASTSVSRAVTLGKILESLSVLLWENERDCPHRRA